MPWWVFVVAGNFLLAVAVVLDKQIVVEMKLPIPSKFSYKSMVAKIGRKLFPLLYTRECFLKSP